MTSSGLRRVESVGLVGSGGGEGTKVALKSPVQSVMGDGGSVCVDFVFLVGDSSGSLSLDSGSEIASNIGASDMAVGIANEV